MVLVNKAVKFQIKISNGCRENSKELWGYFLVAPCSCVIRIVLRRPRHSCMGSKLVESLRDDHRHSSSRVISRPAACSVRQAELQ